MTSVPVIVPRPMRDLNPSQKRKLFDQLNQKISVPAVEAQKGFKELSSNEADQLYNRLSSYQEKKGQRLTQLKMKSIEEESQVFTFKPKINQKSQTTMMIS